MLVGVLGVIDGHAAMSTGGTMQAGEPRVVERPERAYVAVRGLVLMDGIGRVADRIPEVLGWLGTRGIEPDGAPFLRYNIVDMERGLEIEAGWPVAAAVPGDGDVFAGTLPAGRYATVTHVGPFEGLYDATTDLLAWARQQGLAWDTTDTDAGERWGCRLEVYRTNPAEVPEPDRWETDLLFRLGQ
jgi:effector-binding domain-containing protein